MPDFKVLRGTSVIGNGDTTLTLTEGTDFTLETGIASDAWFFRITNSNHTGQGNTSGGGSRAADLHTVHFTYSSDDVVLTRAGTSTNCRVSWEIIQYIGASGGANEIKVRDKGTLSLTSGNTLSTLAVPGSVGTSADCVAWVCGQSSSHNTSTRQHSALYTSRLNGSNFEFERGNGSGTGTVSYAIVEFTGSNWTIQNIQFTQTGSDGTASLGTNVSALSEAFLHNTYRFSNSGNGGLDDCSILVYLSAVGTLTYDATTSSSATDKHHSIWVIENPDLSVQRLDFTMAGTGEEEVDTETITAVSDLEQTMLTVDSNSTGTGTAFPRGYIDARLTSTTEVTFTQSDDGQTSRVVAEIIELPTAAATSIVIEGAVAAATISASAANFLKNYAFDGDTASLQISPQAATLSMSMISALETAGVTVTDYDLSIFRSLVTALPVESITTTSNDANFSTASIVSGDPAAITVVETSADFVQTFKIDAASAAVDVTDIDSVISLGAVLSGAPASIVLQNQLANFLQNYILSTDVGGVEVSDADASLLLDLSFSGETASTQINPTSANFSLGLVIAGQTDAVSITVQDAVFGVTRVIDAPVEVITASAQSAAFLSEFILAGAPSLVSIQAATSSFFRRLFSDLPADQIEIQSAAADLLVTAFLEGEAASLSVTPITATFFLVDQSSVRYVSITLSKNQLTLTASENDLTLTASCNSARVVPENGNEIG